MAACATRFDFHIDPIGQDRACAERIKNNAARDPERLRPYSQNPTSVSSQVDARHLVVHARDELRAPVRSTWSATAHQSCLGSHRARPRSYVPFSAVFPRPEMRPVGLCNPHFQRRAPVASCGPSRFSQLESARVHGYEHPLWPALLLRPSHLRRIRSSWAAREPTSDASVIAGASRKLSLSNDTRRPRPLPPKAP